MQGSPRFTETRTCPQTRNNCTEATFDAPELCDTTTTNPTQKNCLSINAEDCKPTKKCPLTIEPACETKIGCEDSASNAILCCPISDKANTVCTNCYSADSCGNNTQCICQITRDDCNSSPCQISIDNSCTCPLSLEETCPPPVVATEITGCNA